MSQQVWLALLFGISAAGRDEDLSCKVTVFWREFLITSHAALVSSWAYLPVCSVFLLHAFFSAKFAHSESFFVFPFSLVHLPSFTSASSVSAVQIPLGCVHLFLPQLMARAQINPTV